MTDLTADPQASHDRFVQEARASGLVWGLKSDNGWALCDSNVYEDTDVYVFWSAEAEAACHCTDDWSGYVPASLDLDDFIDTWLAGMAEDGVLVGTNWDADLMGLEMEPSDLAAELLAEDDEDEDEDGDDEDPDDERDERD